jgi:transposase
MVEVAQMIHKYYNRIVHWFTSQLNNGLLEGVNSLIQAAKRARGYRSEENLIAMIYLIGGKLKFSYPTLFAARMFVGCTANGIDGASG